MAVYETYTAADGIREDLIDVITNIAPVDTWFLSTIGSTRARQTKHEWQTDSLAVSKENAVVEGTAASDDTVTATDRIDNYTQILRKVFTISDTMEAVNKAGRSSEISYQTQKSLKELAKDIEGALVTNAAGAAGSASVARKMKGINAFIETNITNVGADEDNAVAIGQTKLNDGLEKVWNAGGEPSNLLLGGFQKRKISGFSTDDRRLTATETTLSDVVDIYESDFGTVRVRLHRQMHSDDTYSAQGTDTDALNSLDDVIFILGDMGLWRKAWLRPIKTEKLARDGARTQIMMEAELTLESRQEKGSGKLRYLTTTDT